MINKHNAVVSVNAYFSVYGLCFLTLDYVNRFEQRESCR